MITVETLGSAEFKSDYQLKFAYLVGAMYKGISSVDMIIRLAQNQLLGFFGTGGLSLKNIEYGIQNIQQSLQSGQSYGVNLLCNHGNLSHGHHLIDLFFKYHVTHIEAAAYTQITAELVRFRLKGLHRNHQGDIVSPHHILAKVSHSTVALAFMTPPPPHLVQQLQESGQITKTEAELSQFIPMSHDICVESDSGGHTDQGVALTLLPTILTLRDNIMATRRYCKRIRIGAAGGIGTSHAAAAAFILGADFILTGSINQCTVEAGTSDAVKSQLQTINVHDTTYAPAGDMFEMGSKVQVLSKGTFFPARASQLYELYKQYDSLDDIDEKTQERIQQSYFNCRFQTVWEETKAYYSKENPHEIDKAEKKPKHKMALIFRWYFIYTTRLALQGDTGQHINFQVHCGPALGAFNQWVKNTPLENWRNRHVDTIAEKIMSETANHLNQSIKQWYGALYQEKAAVY